VPDKLPVSYALTMNR